MTRPVLFQLLGGLLAGFCLLGLVASTPTPSGVPFAKRCSSLRLREEWRDLSPVSRASYISAVRCLQSLPARNATLSPKFTRYDEFVLSHLEVADTNHGVGHFLPWHRQFGFNYETALRQECQYRGPFPYWDWTRDTDGSVPITKSSIFDPVTGFGGDGVAGTYTAPTESDNATWSYFKAKGCVLDGPFRSGVYTLHVGPGKRFTDHCLTRGFLENYTSVFTSETVANISSQSDYASFATSLDGGPFKRITRLHDGGHISIGGDFSNFYSSPNDPLFYLHHAGLDRLWWQWQQADLKNRLYQMGGYSTPLEPYGPLVTLDYLLEYAEYTPTVTVGQVMNVGVEPYCYAYP